MVSRRADGRDARPSTFRVTRFLETWLKELNATKLGAKARAGPTKCWALPFSPSTTRPNLETTDISSPRDASSTAQSLPVCSSDIHVAPPGQLVQHQCRGLRPDAPVSDYFLSAHWRQSQSARTQGKQSSHEFLSRPVRRAILCQSRSSQTWWRCTQREMARECAPPRSKY